MLNKITYKQRFYYLIIGGLFVFIFSYWIAISGTVKKRNDLKEIDYKLQELSSAPRQLALLKKNIEISDKKIGENPEDLTEFQKKLFDQISTYCVNNGLVLKEFPKIHSSGEKNYHFITAYANVEGPFVILLKLLYQLETSNSMGRIVSVSFNAIEDRRLKKTKLNMSIYIQTIKRINNANSI